MSDRIIPTLFLSLSALALARLSYLRSPLSSLLAIESTQPFTFLLTVF
ncbi:MAG: hypothetical protein HC895_20325 [Leptolyngbyaceae cyanobacterium SM1_3_5]|nr:hypothetical protein [Leptolyngbyaceae cyanobacterium SM1_3_5]